MARPSAPVVVAIALPLLLAVAVAALGIAGRLGADDVAPAVAPDTRPLAVVPIDAPDAAGPRCAALLAALPERLPGTAGPRTIAEPAPPGARAWVATPRPVVLRCGLPRPAELAPTSALLEVDGVSWLTLDEGGPVVTYVAVDRPVYLALTVPAGAGPGPVQGVSEAVRATLPETAVAVR